MKPLDSDKKPETAEDKPAEAAPAAPAVEEKIDFSNVEIEPLFADFVDFDTFSLWTLTPSPRAISVL